VRVAALSESVRVAALGRFQKLSVPVRVAALSESVRVAALSAGSSTRPVSIVVRTSAGSCPVQHFIAIASLRW